VRGEIVGVRNELGGGIGASTALAPVAEPLFAHGAIIKPLSLRIATLDLRSNDSIRCHNKSDTIHGATAIGTPSG
jgi:hypothetical protein